MFMPVFISILVLGAGAAIINPPPASSIHRRPATIDHEENKRELDQCLALARLEVDESEPYWDDQPTDEECIDSYRESEDGV